MFELTRQLIGLFYKITFNERVNLFALIQKKKKKKTGTLINYVVKQGPILMTKFIFWVAKNKIVIDLKRSTRTKTADDGEGICLLLLRKKV